MSESAATFLAAESQWGPFHSGQLPERSLKPCGDWPLLPGSQGEDKRKWPHTAPGGRFRLDIKKNFFTEKLLSYWHRLAMEMFESPCLAVFKK